MILAMPMPESGNPMPYRILPIMTMGMLAASGIRKNAVKPVNVVAADSIDRAAAPKKTPAVRR